MKKIFFFIFIILILIIILQINKNRPILIIKSLDLHNRLSTEFKTIVFEVNFLGFLPIGEAQLENKGLTDYLDKKVFHLYAQAETLKFISKFFNASCQIASYIDKDKLHSLKFVQTLIIPDKPKETRQVLYDQENHIMELGGVKRKILPDTQDPLSAIFYIQHQLLELGREFDMNINTNQKNYGLFAKAIKKENYKIKDKAVDVWVIKGDILRRDKSPYHRSNITFVCLRTESDNIPVLIKVFAGGFFITARLIEVK